MSRPDNSVRPTDFVASFGGSHTLGLRRAMTLHDRTHLFMLFWPTHPPSHKEANYGAALLWTDLGSARVHIVAAQPIGARKKVAKDKPSKLVGIWQNDASVIVFEEKRVLFGGTDTKSASIVAEYAVSKDNIVFGIITQEKVSEHGDLFPFVSFVDETFRFRVSVDKDQLTIKDARFSSPRILGVESAILGLSASEKDRPANKGKHAANGADDPFKNTFLAVLLLQRGLQGTYERTTKEAIDKERGAYPSNSLGPPPAHLSNPPSYVPPETSAPKLAPKKSPAPSKQ